MEQPDKAASMWKAGLAGGSFAGYTTTLAPRMSGWTISLSLFSFCNSTFKKRKKFRKGVREFYETMFSIGRITEHQHVAATS